MRDPYAWIDPFEGEDEPRCGPQPLDPRDWPEDGDYRDSLAISHGEAMAHARGIATPRDRQLAEMRRVPPAGGRRR